MRERTWSSSKSPVRGRLTGVESKNGVVFGSGDRGVLIRRESRDNWTAVVEDGPRGKGTNLRDISITDDGARVWYCGDDGAFGYYDRAAGEARSHYAPSDYTSGFVTIETYGRSGREEVFFADNSHTILHVTVDGETTELQESTTPSNASKPTEVVDYRGEHFVSTVGGDVFHSESNDSWQQLPLASEPIEALAAADTGVAAVTESGTLYRDVSSTDGVEPREIDLDTHGVEELAVRGKTFVAAGQDGRIALLDAAGGATYPDPAPGVSLYAAEVLTDGTVVTAGSEGTILEGTP